MSQMAIDVSKIEPMKEVEREVYDPSKLKRLREDIRRHSIHNPIHVIKKPRSKDRYETFIGIHRLKCAKALTEKDKQFSYVPVIIENISREEAIAKGFRDNNLQEPINPMDTARTIKILKGHGLNYEKIAKMLFGSEKHLSLVKQYARLLHLPLAVQNRVKEGRIPWSNAILFVKLMNNDMITEACEFSIRYSLGREEIKERIRSEDFGEISRKIQGNPTRCFSCGDMTSYKKSRSKQICLDCLKKIGKATVNPLTELSKKGKLSLEEHRKIFRRLKDSKAVNSLTDLPEVHAYWDEDEEGFIPYVGSEEERKLVYGSSGIVEFLEEKGIPPDEQVIEGWSRLHEIRWRKHTEAGVFKKPSKKEIKAFKKKWKLSDANVKYLLDYAMDEDVSFEHACRWWETQRGD